MLLSQSFYQCAKLWPMILSLYPNYHHHHPSVLSSIDLVSEFIFIRDCLILISVFYMHHTFRCYLSSQSQNYSLNITGYVRTTFLQTNSVYSCPQYTYGQVFSHSQSLVSTNILKVFTVLL